MKQPIIALVTTFTYMNASNKTKVSELGHFALFFFYKMELWEVKKTLNSVMLILSE